MQLIAFIAIFTNTTLERLFFLHASVATMRSMQEEAPRESRGFAPCQLRARSARRERVSESRQAKPGYSFTSPEPSAWVFGSMTHFFRLAVCFTPF